MVLSELSRNLEMPRDAVRRKLQRLIEIGLVERIDQRYHMTAKANAPLQREASSQFPGGHKRSVRNEEPPQQKTWTTQRGLIIACLSFFQFGRFKKLNVTADGARAAQKPQNENFGRRRFRGNSRTGSPQRPDECDGHHKMARLRSRQSGFDLRYSSFLFDQIVIAVTDSLCVPPLGLMM